MRHKKCRTDRLRVPPPNRLPSCHWVPMEAKLLVVAGDAKETEIKLKLPTVIGRSRDADVTIAHPLVSRRHCEIAEGEDGRLHVRDLGSLNGTFVGQTRVEESTLAPGDLLTVGAITFRAVYGDYDENDADSDSIDFTPTDDQPAVMVDTQISHETEPVPDRKLAEPDDIPLTEVPDSQTEPVPSRPKTEPAKAATDKAENEENFDLDWLMDDD